MFKNKMAKDPEFAAEQKRRRIQKVLDEREKSPNERILEKEARRDMEMEREQEVKNMLHEKQKEFMSPGKNMMASPNIFAGQKNIFKGQKSILTPDHAHKSKGMFFKWQW